MIDAVARPPLRLAIDQTGVADQAAVPGGRPLEPVDQVAAVAGAGCRLARRVDVAEASNRLVGGFVDVLRRTVEGIVENRAREFLAESSGPRVVGRQDDVAGAGE